MLFGLCVAQNSVITMTRSGDTITNTGTDHVDYQVKYNYQDVSFQAKVTKISGTLTSSAAALLQGSIDGINFKDITTDTLQLSDVTTNTKIWVIAASPYAYYRIAFVGAGTMSASVFGYMLVNGQSGAGQSANLLSTYSNVIDTVTNSATNTIVLRVKGWYKTVVVQPVITKISGTAAGTVTLQGSNDGTNYVTVSSSFSDGQTLTVTNVTTSTKLFKITGSPYAYYRLSYTGSGTMSCKLRGYFFGQN